MKQLLIVTALIEVGAGLALLCCPSAAVALLLGAPLDTPAAISLGRVAGAALFALGVASWLAHYDEKSRAARGVVSAMVLYNLGTVVILAVAALSSQPGGVVLWLAIVLHAAMTVWCVASLWENQSKR
jgi:Kef-type K+ transport system membrane component KefB